MALMIPPQLPLDAPTSEQIAFRLLNASPIAENWVVFHSVRVRVRGRARRREIDFLVLIPDIGIISLEVKGGPFEIRQGEWYRPGASETVESPLDQAERAMYAFRNEIANEFRREWGAAELVMECAVVFCDIKWPNGLRDPGIPVISLPELESQGSKTIADRLIEIARTARRNITRQTPLNFSVERIQKFVNWMSPDVIILPTPRPAPHRHIEQHLIRLTNEQFDALEISNNNERCLIRGGPGSGKTMLAMELAQRRANEERVALLCYNRILGDFLYDATREYQKLGGTGNIVGSFWHHFTYSIIGSSSFYADFALAMDNPRGWWEANGNGHGDNLSDNDIRYDKICPEYILKSLDESGPRFDYLIVDELQDMCRENDPYLEIMDKALHGGLEKGKWAMFWGSDQDLPRYPQAAPPPSDLVNLDIYTDRYELSELLINCRNTQPIAEAAASIIGRDPQEATPVEGPPVVMNFWRSDSELRTLLDREVRSRVNQGESIEDICVLGIRELRDSGLLHLLEDTYGGYEMWDCPGIYWPDRPNCDQNPCCRISRDSDQYLKFRSVRRFKGMESKVIILVADRVDQDWYKQAMYVGETRARVELVILAHVSAERELRERFGQ